MESIRMCFSTSPYTKCFEIFFSDKPHNPMINSGAIITTSLIKQHLSSADRFDYVML